jgi:CRP/FNR family transcriptional regulator
MSANDSNPCKNGFQVSCGNCQLSAICLPIALETREIDQLDNIIQRGRPVRKGEHIFREDDEFGAVYAVRSGSLKTYSVTKDGKEQVTGFYLPGEIFGLDGIGENRHTNSAKALETSAICEIPFHQLQELSGKVAGLQRNMFHIIGQEINYDKQLITLLSKNSADERIASLLVSISSRNARRKLSSTSFRLPMSRTDIGNYLGLTVETVSRTFSRFQKMELIQVDNKEITILDVDKIQEIAHGSAAA